MNKQNSQYNQLLKVLTRTVVFLFIVFLNYEIIVYLLSLIHGRIESNYQSFKYLLKCIIFNYVNWTVEPIVIISIFINIFSINFLYATALNVYSEKHKNLSLYIKILFKVLLMLILSFSAPHIMGDRSIFYWSYFVSFISIEFFIYFRPIVLSYLKFLFN